MNLTQIAAYVAVIDAGGFRAAASRLGVTQGAVSQHIRRLEVELGATVVQRDPVRCVPTPAHAAFERYARTLLDVSERATKLFSDPELVVGSSSNIGTYLLQPLIKSIGEAHTDLYRIRQVIGTNSDIVDRLASGEVDVAFTEWWDQRPGFEATPWRDEPLMVIVGPAHQWAGRRSVPVDDLAQETMLGGEPASGTGTLLRNVLGDDAGKLPATVNLGSTAAVKSAVTAGLGVSLVLAASTSEEVASGQLHALALEGPQLRKRLWVVHRSALVPTDPAAAFTRAIMDARIGDHAVVADGAPGRA